MTPRVLNIRDKQSGWDIWDRAVYVGRPTKWGNPYVIGRDGNRAQVIAKYRDWLATRPDFITMAKKELRGKDLACHCAPRACHGDILLAVANEQPMEAFDD